MTQDPKKVTPEQIAELRAIDVSGEGYGPSDAQLDAVLAALPALLDAAERYANIGKWDFLLRERDDLARRLGEAEAKLSRIGTWTHEHGAALKPKRADTYGEGMRDAKEQVAALLSTLTTPPADGDHAKGGG